MKLCVLATMVVLASSLTLAGCPEEGPRKIGASCTSDGQCASGLCAAQTCLDPEADEDGDTLVNRIEAALGTDPFAADSDGDGTSDRDEIGDLAAPTDGDGDGRIDAIESAVRDADGDCVVDEVDPRDSYSDPPSEAFPEACGDGSYSCVANPLAGTCAAPLGVMAAECFQAWGACEIAVTGTMSGSSSISWESGAHMTWKISGDSGTAQLVGPSGATCGTMRVTDAQSESPTTTLLVTGGPSYGLRNVDGTLIITCPGGTEVILSETDAEAFSRCSGADSQERCTVSSPYNCTSSAECEGDLECCVLPQAPSAGAFCMPVEACTAQ
ncbi:MAG: hypothetical protein EP329_21290 [Deltaproteobacteria bacterium]|nr:MAG: hypothetical protein EP329_21290 [Deltaproteobacteria bacterium]